METRCGGSEGAKPVVQTIERMALWSSGQDLRAHTTLDVLEPQYPRLEDGAHRHTTGPSAGLLARGGGWTR